MVKLSGVPPDDSQDLDDRYFSFSRSDEQCRNDESPNTREQTPAPAAAPTVPRDVDVRRDDDIDWGWLGLIGLLGLGGLAGRRRDVVVGTTRPRP